MPELPEVENVKRSLESSEILGKKIIEVDVLYSRTVGDPCAFIDSCLGKEIKSMSRHGKNLFIHLAPSGFIAVHLKMSGRFILREAVEEVSKHEHLVLTLSNHKKLCFHDTRKFGRCIYVESLEMVTSKLGLEPFSDEFTFDRFMSIWKERKRPLKSLLLDQTFITGLGNIYADECLWRSFLHPERMSQTLTPKELRLLYDNILEVLKLGILRGGTSLASGLGNFHNVNGHVGENRYHLKVYAQKGKPCERCMTPITKIMLFGRGTHFCLSCQRC